MQKPLPLDPDPDDLDDVATAKLLQQQFASQPAYPPPPYLWTNIVTKAVQEPDDLWSVAAREREERKARLAANDNHSETTARLRRQADHATIIRALQDAAVTVQALQDAAMHAKLVHTHDWHPVHILGEATTDLCHSCGDTRAHTHFWQLVRRISQPDLKQCMTCKWEEPERSDPRWADELDRGFRNMTTGNPHVPDPDDAVQAPPTIRGVPTTGPNRREHTIDFDPLSSGLGFLILLGATWAIAVSAGWPMLAVGAVALLLAGVWGTGTVPRVWPKYQAWRVRVREAEAAKIQRLAAAKRAKLARLEADAGVPLVTDGTCPQCQHALPVGAIYCPSCKAQVAVDPADLVKTCPACGERQMDDAVVCHRCGAPQPQP